MLPQLNSDVMLQRSQNNFHAFATYKFERGHEIRVSRDNDNGSNHFPQCEAGHVHSDPHVDAFLRQIQFEVGID